MKLVSRRVRSRPRRVYLGLSALGLLAVLALVALGAGVLPAPLSFPGPPDPSKGWGLSLYLPVANVSTSLPLLLAIGFTVGILSGLTGVGGGFLMTPLLMTIGIPASPAVGSDNMQIAGTASSGAIAHWRRGNVDVRLGLAILLGSLVGGTAGVQIVAALRALGNFEFFVRLTYVVVLGTVGSLMLRESLQAWVSSARSRSAALPGRRDSGGPKPEGLGAKKGAGTRFGSLAAGWPLQTEFKRSGVRSSLIFPFGLGVGIGTLVALMGVGGGFIMVPAMIYILGIPTHVAVGTGLFQIVFTSGNVGLQQALINHNVDVVLTLVTMVGGALGAQVGAAFSHRLEGHQLRTFLATVVLLVMAKLLLDIVLPPASLITVIGDGAGGH